MYELTQLGTSTVFVARLSRWISADYAFTFVYVTVFSRILGRNRLIQNV